MSTAPSAPQPQTTGNPILDEPATVDACQQDYADAAGVRARLGWTDESDGSDG